MQFFKHLSSYLAQIFYVSASKLILKRIQSNVQYCTKGLATLGKVRSYVEHFRHNYEVTPHSNIDVAIPCVKYCELALQDSCATCCQLSRNLSPKQPRGRQL